MEVISSNTTVSVQEAVVTSDGEFLRLSDKKPGEQPDTERMTVGQAAETISNIFGKGTCKQPDKPDAYTPSTDPNTSIVQGAADYLNTKYPGSSGVAELAKKFGVQNLCPATMAPSGKKTLPVYVHASSNPVFEDYNLVSYGSQKSGPVIVEEDIQVRFEFTRSASLPIYYYINYKRLADYLRFQGAYGKIFEWRGNPKNNRGERVDPPSVRIQGGQVMLHGYYSGILIVRRLPIKYHRWEITITGTALGNGKREYKGRVSAISSAYGLGPVHQQVGESETVQDKAAECPVDSGLPFADEDVDPDEIYCYIEVRNKLLQQCTGDYLRDLPTEYRQVKCPDEDITPRWNSPMALDYNPALPKYIYKMGQYEVPSYSYEGTTRQITDAEYKEACCHAPVKTGCVPYCREIKSTYYGPVDIEGGRQKYIDQYPGKTVFVPVETESGICGTLTNKFVDPDSQCCAGVSPITYRDDLSPSVITEGWHANVYFDGGKLPYFVDLQGTGFWLDAAGTQSSGEVNSRSFKIYALGSCGVCTVTVEDGCQNTETAQLRSTNVEWENIYNCYAGIDTSDCGIFCFDGVNKIFENWCGGGCDTCDHEVCGGPLTPVCESQGGTEVEGKQIWRPICPGS